ncbi:FkbM family methyltransferase [Rhizobium sp. LjRoot254]|uniref:FkbM family methyltransferase n=1 Tax=Rhizobium sp. LjRoot254 TaxID=3342297 RepID=UPI003ECE3A9E
MDNSLARMFRRLRDRLASRFFDTRYGRDLLIKAIGSRTRFITVDNGDHLITFSPADYLGRSVFVKGHFDRDHVDRLMRHLKALGLGIEGKTLLEIGGNIGTHTIYFALTGAFGRIVTVEPDPRNFELLVENITQNGFDELVVPINCAASDIEGQIDFFLHPDNHGKSSPNSRSAADIKIAVPARPVPAILADAGIAEADVGLVWMDIEGYEPIACRSMTSLFERRVSVHCEFTSEFYGAEKAAEFVGFLARYYEDCLVFFNDDSMARMKVADIPLDREQFDILLIP